MSQDVKVTGRDLISTHVLFAWLGIVITVIFLGIVFNMQGVPVSWAVYTGCIVTPFATVFAVYMKRLEKGIQ